jgi:hypothetical protein
MVGPFAVTCSGAAAAGIGSVGDGPRLLAAVGALPLDF